MSTNVIEALGGYVRRLGIPEDKFLHIVLGTLWLVASFGGYQVLALFGVGPMLAYQTTVFGILYEVNQWYRKEGNPDFWDAVATAFPGYVAWATMELMK